MDIDRVKILTSLYPANPYLHGSNIHINDINLISVHLLKLFQTTLSGMALQCGK